MALNLLAHVLAVEADKGHRVAIFVDDAVVGGDQHHAGVVRASVMAGPLSGQAR